MHTITLLPLALFLLSILTIPLASAKCCLASYEAHCGDGSHSTPCCGYKKCNGFCCACEGVQLIRQEVPQTKCNGDYFTTTSVITAPAGTTWTCRDDHITARPPRVRAATTPSGNLTSAPVAYTPAAKFQGRPHQPASECGDILNRVSHGSGRVTLEQYWQYYNVTDEQSPQYAAVEAMFHARDKDGNGVLTVDEVEEMLSYDDVMQSG